MTARLPDPELLKAFGLAIRRNFAEQIANEREAAAHRRATVVPLVRAAIARARAEGWCGAAWLFGSYAWGEPGERSDVDIFVEGRRDTFAIASLVGRACGLDVHVVDSAEAPETLRQRVLTEGQAL
jgi:predicted nucleotidyltransferase